MENKFVQKTLDTLLEVVEVEFKIPLGVAEIKFPVTAPAKKWWKNKKSRLEVKKAIQRAEESFIAAHPEEKVAQILHELPLYSEEDYQKVILELLSHLHEEKIIWLAEVKLEKIWGRIVTVEEIRKALGLYLPFLRHELNEMEEFREIINARAIERIDEGVKRIESKLDKVLDIRQDDESKQESDFWNLKHPYPMPPNFTGRVAERAMLTQWLNEDNENRLFILRALGGFGKSALTWYWLTNDVNSKVWPKVVFWSFYEGDASFENFTRETLEYLGVEIPQGRRPQAEQLLKTMLKENILLVVDGFERVFRLYASMNAAYQSDEEQKVDDAQLDCVDNNAEWFLKSVCANNKSKSKVLMTTRHAPRVIKPHGEFILGCREAELIALKKEDAVEFFRKQGVHGNRAEIEVACAPYEYHPLSLRILAGLIIDDRETPGDIVVTRKLDITDDIIANKHHVLEVSFKTLSSEQQKLLSTISCFRSPIKYVEIKLISGVPLRKRSKTKNSSFERLEVDLQTLENRGLLQWNRNLNKYDLHPIVRRFTYLRLSEQERKNTHNQLGMYFIDIVPTTNRNIRTLEDLGPIIELYHHMICAGQLDAAAAFYHQRLKDLIFFHFSAYQLCIELVEALFQNNYDKIPRLKSVDAQAWALHELANAYFRIGQPRLATHFFESAMVIDKENRNNEGIAMGLVNMADVYICVGALRDASINLQQFVEISERPHIHKMYNGAAHSSLGQVFSYLGKWDDANRELDIGEEIAKETNNIQPRCVILTYRALRAMLMIRDPLQNKIDNLNSAIRFSQHAIELETNIQFSVESHFVHAHWLLGSAHRVGEKFSLAEQYLNEALSRDRAINFVLDEADILLDIARLRYDQQNYDEAKSLAEEALAITERSGYVLQGADVNLFLAQYVLERENDKVKSKEYAETALKLAYCDGPPYYYKVAYEEAERMLEKLK